MFASRVLFESVGDLNGVRLTQMLRAQERRAQDDKRKL